MLRTGSRSPNELLYLVIFSILIFSFVNPGVKTAVTSSSDSWNGARFPTVGTSDVWGENSGQFSSETGEQQHSDLSFFQASADTFEPDNNITFAKEILVNTTQTHSIYPIGDIDWVFFEINITMRIALETSGDRGYDTAIKLFDSEGTLLGFNDDGGEYLYSKMEMFLRPSRYYVAIEGFANSSEIPSYNITFSAWRRWGLPNSPGSDPFEPDNTPTQAVVIFSGDTVTRAINPRDDTDWFMFTVESASYVDIVTYGPQLADTYINLYNENLSLEVANDNFHNLFAEVHTVLEPGVYYFSVTSYAGRYVIDEYKVSLRITPKGPDQYEYDNDIENATLLLNGEWQVHTIHDNEDVDYFKLTLENDSFVRIEFDYYEGWLWYEVLQEENGSLYERYVDPNRASFLEAGTYYIQVRASDTFSYGYYYLRVYWSFPQVIQFDENNTQYYVNSTIDYYGEPFVAFLANFSNIQEIMFYLEFYDNDYSSLEISVETETTMLLYGVDRSYPQVMVPVLQDEIYRIIFYSWDRIPISFGVNITAYTYQLDLYEPDNDVGSATRIDSSTGQQEHSLFPAGDTDWFVFKVDRETAQVEFTIDLLTSNSDQLVTAKIYYNYDRVNPVWEESLTSRRTFGLNLTMGEYYLVIKAEKDTIIPQYFLEWDISGNYIKFQRPSTGGEVFEIGEIMTIEWESEGIERVTIRLYESETMVEEKLIVNYYENTGEFLWKIVDVPPGSYFLVIHDSYVPTYDAWSPIFTIREGEGSVQNNGGGGFFRISFQLNSAILALAVLAFIISPRIRKKHGPSRLK